MNYEFNLEDLNENTSLNHQFVSNNDFTNLEFYFDKFNYLLKTIDKNIELNRYNDNMIMKMTFKKNKKTLYLYEDLKNNLKMSLNIYTNDLFYDNNILVIFYTIEETDCKYKITLKRS